MGTEVVQINQATNDLREKFLRAIFGEGEGYLCFAIKTHRKDFEQKFFLYPTQLPEALSWINRNFYGVDVYFCPQLFSKPERKKAYVSFSKCVWADLDTCPPSQISPAPTMAVETSHERYHGYWLLDEPLVPEEAEDLSHRIAYHFKAYGVDPSGWDITQLLRVPLTYNVKNPMDQQVVKYRPDLSTRHRYNRDAFKTLPPVPEYEYMDAPIPDISKLDPSDILAEYRSRISPQAELLYSTTPNGDWSNALWNLECLLFEAGLEREQVFCVVRVAECNKYNRDNRGDLSLWREVCKAGIVIEERQRTVESAAPIEVKSLLTPEERRRIIRTTFIDDYVKWAKDRSDSSESYFIASAFAILSGILSDRLRLNMNYGNITPNLWFMILGNTTIHRKSTAMDMAMEILLEIKEDAILATDGSLEGMLTEISRRPKKTSLFWRDEFAGLLDSVNRKDYMAGMIESLTRLYDGKYQKRILSKQVFEIADPIFLMFCGGPRSRILELLTKDHITSGFAPRFIFVEPDAKLRERRPLGPPTETQDKARKYLIHDLKLLDFTYEAKQTIQVKGRTVETKRIWTVELTPAAWDRYNELETQMVDSAMKSAVPEIYTPMMDRLAKSILKAAVLIAASLIDPRKDMKVVVDIPHLIKAISYGEKWRDYALDIADNAGETLSERRINTVLAYIQEHEGIGRSDVMRTHKLTSKDMDFIIDTLQQRGQIVRERGRPERYYDIKAKAP